MNQYTKNYKFPFNKKLILELKKNLKQDFHLGFSKTKNHKKYWHLDEFISELTFEKLKNTIYINKNNELDVKLLLQNIVLLDEKIKKTINVQYFLVYTKQKLEETQIYFTLKFVNIFEYLLNLNAELIIKPELKKRIKIPKSLRISLWDKRFLNKRSGNCYCCNNIIDITNFEAGHINSHYNSGKTNIDNLEPICNICNKSMNTENMNILKKKFFKNELSLEI